MDVYWSTLSSIWRSVDEFTESRYSLGLALLSSSGSPKLMLLCLVPRFIVGYWAAAVLWREEASLFEKARFAFSWIVTMWGERGLLFSGSPASLSPKYESISTRLLPLYALDRLDDWFKLTADVIVVFTVRSSLLGIAPFSSLSFSRFAFIYAVTFAWISAFLWRKNQN